MKRMKFGFQNRVKGNVETLYRFLASYIIVLCINMFLNRNSVSDFSFFKETSMIYIVLGTMVLWLLLSLFCKDSLVVPLLISAMVLYSYEALRQNRSEYFLFGCIAVLALLIVWIRTDHIKLELSNETAWLCILGFALAISLLVGIVCIFIYRNNGTSCFDFGIFAQMYYYMKEKGLPLTTCERDGLLSHFAVHISPIYYLLLPVYMLSPRPETLLAAQCIITFSGVIPLYLICRKHRLSNAASVAFAFCFVLVPSFTGGCYYYFHENNFLPPMLLWLVYFFEQRDAEWKTSKAKKVNTLLLLLFAVLSLGIKEDAAIYVAVIALFFLVRDIREEVSSEKNLKKNLLGMGKSEGLWVLVLSVVYFVCAVLWLSSSGDGAMTGRYNNYIYDGSGSLMVMLAGLIKNPIYVILQCMTPEKILFLLYMAVPLALMPFMSGKIENWILFIPCLLINLMPNYGYQQSVRYQYAFGSGALLVYLSVLNYKNLGKYRKKILILAVAASILSYGFHYGGRLETYWKAYHNNSEYRDKIDLAAERIPDDAMLASATFLLPYFSQRSEVYELETTQTICEYYALDLRGAEVDPKYLDEDSYEEIYRADGAIGIYRLKDWKANMHSPQKEFSIAAKTMRDSLERLTTEFLKEHEVTQLGNIVFDDGTTAVRVMGDQHWTVPSESGEIEVVFLVDGYGTLVYMSYRNADYVATWSGPTKDEALIAAEGGWSGGNGAGWTGNIIK